MKCANCGAEVRDGARFCVMCGYDLRVVNQSHGNENMQNSTQAVEHAPIPEPPESMAEDDVSKGERWSISSGILCALAIMAILAVIIAPRVLSGGSGQTVDGKSQTSAAATNSPSSQADKAQTDTLQADKTQSEPSSSQPQEKPVTTVNCVVTFDGNGATGGSMSTTTLKQGELVEIPECGFVRDGYEFVRWEDGDGRTYYSGDVVNVSSSLGLYATWRARTYTVQFFGGGANGGDTSDIAARYGEYITLPACGYYRDGYEFDRWESSTGITYRTGDTYNVTDDTSFTAKWIAKSSTDESIHVLDTDTKHMDRYELVKADLSWTEANAECVSKGGHLVTITSQAEMDAITSMAEQAGIDYVWLGGYTTSGGVGTNGQWVTGESFSFSAWYEGEPSHYDTDGTPETCIEMWRFKSTGKWSWNDERDNPLESDVGSEYMSGCMGYVCEYED